jgi:TadE-like protein
MGGARSAWRNGGAMGGEGGQAVVEAAFALPLTVLLILGTIQITQLQRARLLVEYAAFNAARAGAVQNGNDGSDGTTGPMHDAAALSLLSSQGPTDSLGALARTWAAFRAREAALRALGLPLVQVIVLNPRRGDFRSFGQHLGGQEIDFDDVRPRAVDASLLSIQVRYLVELRVPLANKLIHSLWLASRAFRGRQGEDPAPGGLDLASLALAGRQGRYLLPVQAFHTLRMQSNAFLRWAAP